jgi:FkbM family methyltransferase
MISIKRLLNRALNRWAGCEIKSVEYLDQFVFPYQLRKILKIFSIDCVLDVGACTGDYYKFLRRDVEFRGKIISFEPVKKSFKVLEAAVPRDAMWFVYNYALGSAEATQEINVMEGKDFSSFLMPDDMEVTKFRAQNKIAYREKVQVKRLDDVWPTLREKHVLDNFYLKLDTQGCDLEVLKGSAKTLPHIVALQTELSVQAIYQNMPHYLEVLQFLEEWGFSVAGFYPVTKDEHLRIIELDCMMIKGKRGTALTI